MDGDLGFYQLSPDQTNLIGSIVYVALIPILQFVLVPRLERGFGILRTPLQKMIVGGIFVVAAFVVAAGVAFAVENQNQTAAAAQLRICNTLPCDDVSIFCPEINSTAFRIEKGRCYENGNLKSTGNQSLNFEVQSSCANISGSFLVNEQKTVGYYFKEKQAVMFVDDGPKEDLGLGLPLVRY